ncbi:peptidylprolyl isomerase [Romboutsia sp. 13368]|uniref:peptidylprolyl isomerase n=1 Tax=Romboutsia sp. 13368 TaxID=2708053 RepID=UPI0025EFEC4E|nr:peptidylprolyl isomerase [Romboutsia sp. 13368]
MSEDKKISKENEESKIESSIEEKTENNNDELTEEVVDNKEDKSSEIINTEESVENNTKSKLKKFKHGKSIIAMAVVGCICLGLGFTYGKSVGRVLPATSRNYRSNKVIATVGDTKLTGEQLRQKIEPLFYINAKTKMTDEEIDAYEASMIDYMTTTEVLYLEGKAEGIKVEKEDVESEYSSLISSLEQTYNITEDDLINKCNIPKEDILKELEKELIAVQYIGKESEVTEKEAENYYNKNKDEFLTVRASHILIKNTDDEGNSVSDEQKKKNKEKAEDILKQAKEGVDFAQLAKEYSEDTSSEKGGDLDFFSKGQMVEPFEKAAFSLKNGEIYPEVVETDYGYHIIKKTDEKYEDFDTIKEELVYTLGYEKQSNILDNLIEKYNVEIK